MVHQASSRRHETEPEIVRITHERDIPRARRVAIALAEQIGLARAATFEIATSTSELAANLAVHAARGGAITLRAVRRNGAVGVELVAEDDGPGIPNVSLAMRDGFTTKHGLGGGLPAVERLMDEFDITSTAGAGTRIVARRWQQCR